MHYCQLAALLSLAWSLSSAVEQPSRAWDFNLSAPGTYNIQVEHDVSGIVPNGTKVTYTFTVDKETRSQEYPLVAGHPFIRLNLGVTHPAKMHVAITGLPRAALRHTNVYVYDAKSQFPGEYFDPSKSIELKDAKLLQAILHKPDDQIDLARTKLAIDKMVDPSIDVEATLRQIDAMVAAIKAMPEFGTDNLVALRRYVYEAGPWNGSRPFQYDLADPLGRELKSKLLPSYLASKKGNCVSMPLLIIVLGQRLGLDVTAATAPTHLFVKLKTDDLGWINLEATSGAKPARDVWIRQQMPMSDQALASGVYMQPLTKKETVAEMAVVIAENYFQRQEYEQSIAIADVILRYYPKAVDTMILKGVAYGKLANARLAGNYPSPDSVPERYRAYFAYLSDNNRAWFAKAEALGWREETGNEKQDYLQKVDQAHQRIAN
jgi:regulator of sirC expression with transglutaminase-like and TPR domain